ncbi:expressed unknown protein [Seminavis robusta]|uniref:Uncharacterized protein n=1 Tax=Seminavis robusta TaxID=568900 RepID=A0A9N8ESX6_9STRA|nr:expressed unknown protein [Seminavis robusta]|eukprot:Sro1866_g302530.1 n/a (350) ;mRNA; f:15582-16729
MMDPRKIFGIRAKASKRPNHKTFVAEAALNARQPLTTVTNNHGSTFVVVKPQETNKIKSKTVKSVDIQTKTKNADNIGQALLRRRSMEHIPWLLKNQSAVTKNDLLGILSSKERADQFGERIVRELFRADEMEESHVLEALQLIQVLMGLLPATSKWRWHLIESLAHCGAIEAILTKLERVASPKLQRRCLAVLAHLSDHPSMPSKLFHPTNFGVTIKVKPMLSLMVLLRGNQQDPVLLSCCCYILYNYCLYNRQEATRTIVSTPNCLECLERAHFYAATYHPNAMIVQTVNEIFRRMAFTMQSSMKDIKKAKFGKEEQECEVHRGNRPRTTTLYDMDRVDNDIKYTVL